MPSCHACPCITAPLPDISCRVCVLAGEAGVAAPITVFSRGFNLSGGLNDNPITDLISCAHIHTHWARRQRRASAGINTLTSQRVKNAAVDFLVKFSYQMKTSVTEDFVN